MSSWPVQDAKARFSELLDTALKQGPQVVTRRGVEAVRLASDFGPTAAGSGPTLEVHWTSVEEMRCVPG